MVVIRINKNGEKIAECELIRNEHDTLLLINKEGIDNVYDDLIQTDYMGYTTLLEIDLSNKNEVVSMDITKQKDNEKFKSETYVDSEYLRDNFDGSDKQLKIIAQTVYECVDGTVPDEDFVDGCQSMLQYDYDYLKPHQEDTVLDLIEELVCNNGEFKGE